MNKNKKRYMLFLKVNTECSTPCTVLGLSQGGKNFRLSLCVQTVASMGNATMSVNLAEGLDEIERYQGPFH